MHFFFLAPYSANSVFCFNVYHKAYASSTSRCAARQKRAQKGVVILLKGHGIASKPAETAVCIESPAPKCLCPNWRCVPHPQSVTRELTIRPFPARDGGSSEPTSPAVHFGGKKKNPLFPLETKRFISLDILSRKEDECGNEAACQSLAVSEFVSKANSQPFCPTVRA